MDQATAIQEGRDRLKMSQEHLAQAAGISSRTVVRAESGFKVSGESLRSICAVLGLDATALSPVAGKPPEDTDSSEAIPERPARAPEPEGLPAPAAPGLPLIRRLLGLRRAPVTLVAIMILMAASLVSFVPMLERAEIMGDAGRWTMESSPARATAGYVNALAAGREGLRPPSFFYMTCPQDTGRRERFLEWIFDGECPVRRHEILTETTTLPDGTVQTVAGPVGREFGRDLARRLSGDPGVRWRVAFASGRQALGLAWFDPRSVPTLDMPRPPDTGSTWVYVAMTRTGVAR